MLGKAIQPEIGEMIAARQFDELREALMDLETADVAEIVADLPAEDQAVVFRILPREVASDAFEHLPIENQEDLLRNLSAEALGQILNAMDPDDRTRLLEELPGGVTQRLLKMLDPDELKVARKLLGYPEQSIGRLMTPEYVAARPEWSVARTLDFIRETGSEAETITYIYVVDERGRLIDDLHLGRLVMADPEARLADLAEESFIALSALDDREEAALAFKKYDRIALPVLDSLGVLLGIVTVDDAMDVEEDEATEDVQMFGGNVALEDSYFRTTSLELIRKRGGWLTFLFVGGLITSLAIEHFEGLLSQFIILSAFVPLVLSSGGNSGSQSASMIIRSLAVQEMDLKDWRRVLGRELTIGLVLGCFLGVIVLLYILALGRERAGSLALISFISVMAIVTLGTLCGGLMPFFFKRIGFDPAVSSSPFIATVVDLSGVFLYLSLAQWILGT